MARIPSAEAKCASSCTTRLKTFQACSILKRNSALLLLSSTNLIIKSKQLSHDKAIPTTQPFRGVIVFDIDDCLAIKHYNDAQEAECAQLHPECPMIAFHHEGKRYPHYFLPYLDVLFEYLIQKNLRLAFFSSGIEERNVSVLNQLFEHLWGKEQAQAYKEAGHCAIFSRQHLKEDYHDDYEGNGEFWDPNRHYPIGHYTKDLRVVLQPGESMDNILLVEDSPSYAAYDQYPCLIAMDLCRWDWQEKTHHRENFAKNGTYYLLGVFHQYFSLGDHQNISLKEGMAQCLQNCYRLARPEDRSPYPGAGEHPFIYTAVDQGVRMVRQQYPEAVLYGQERRQRFETSQAKEEGR